MLVNTAFLQLGYVPLPDQRTLTDQQLLSLDTKLYIQFRLKSIHCLNCQESKESSV